MSGRAGWLLLCAAGCLLAAGAAPVRGAGPLAVSTAAVPVIWRDSVSPFNPRSDIPYNPDLGPLGTQTESQAQALVTEFFQVWEDVPDCVAGYVNNGSMPEDVNGTNFNTYVDVAGDGLNPIVFDTDGTIHDALFGGGNSVLGFAGFVSFFPDSARIFEGQAAFNGRFIDGNAANGEVGSLNVFKGTFVHEFGHYSGLDHAQINNLEAFDGDVGNDGTVPTMYPINIFQGDSTERLSPNTDDIQGICALYPSPGFPETFGKISGTVFAPDGTSLQGVNVVARRVDNPRVAASSCVSGYLFQQRTNGVASTLFGTTDTAFRGTFDIFVTPGNYTIEVESIDRRFNGGSSVGPVSPPIVGGAGEFFNGFAESADPVTDNPADAVVIPVSAGQAVAGINVTLNRASGVFEFFNTGGFDLSNTQLVLTPDWTARGGYRAQVLTGVTGFPIDPTGHTTRVLADNGFVTLNTALGLLMPLFQSTFLSVNICANGMLTFGSPGAGESDATPTEAEMFAGNGKIAAFWDNLDPGAGGRVSSAFFTNGLCVTFESVPIAGSSTLDASFQVFLEEATGKVFITYLNCNSPGPTMVGISTGGFSNFHGGQVRDFSSLGNDTTPPNVVFRSPGDRETVSGVIIVEGRGTDSPPSSGTPILTHFIDGQFMAEGTDMMEWDTRLWLNGEHRLEILARDPAGNSTRVGIVVNVDNAGGAFLRQRVFNYVRTGDQMTCDLEFINEGPVTVTNVLLRELLLEVTGTFSGTKRAYCNPKNGALLPRVVSVSIPPGGSVTLAMVVQLPPGTNFVSRWVTHGQCDQGTF